MAFIDETNNKYGMLTVLCRAENDKKGNACWLCKCNCGKEITVRGTNLRYGGYVSCGACSKFGNTYKRTHNNSNTRLYRIWIGMISRCENPNNSAFNNYGKRGIVVCNEWRENFEAFKDWALLNGYQNNLTIDRINNNEGYLSDNCQWVTYKQQNNNRRNNSYITAFGKTMTIAEWSDYTGINQGKLWNRIHICKMHVEDALTRETKHSKPITAFGKTMSISDWSKIVKIDVRTIQSRIEELGWTVEDALSKPVRNNCKLNPLNKNIS